MNQSIISSVHGTLILRFYERILFTGCRAARPWSRDYHMPVWHGSGKLLWIHVLFLVRSPSRRLNDSHLVSGRNISAVSSVGAGWSLKVSQVPKQKSLLCWLDFLQFLSHNFIRILKNPFLIAFFLNPVFPCVISLPSTGLIDVIPEKYRHSLHWWSVNYQTNFKDVNANCLLLSDLNHKHKNKNRICRLATTWTAKANLISTWFTVLVNDKVISTWTQQLNVQRTLKLCQCSRSSPPWMRDISSLYEIFLWHRGLSGFISLKWSFHRRNFTINLFLGVFRQLIPAFQDSTFSRVIPITRRKWLLITLDNLT